MHQRETATGPDAAAELLLVAPLLDPLFPVIPRTYWHADGTARPFPEESLPWLHLELGRISA
ncbi:hypothetical protein GCM10010269_13240 [Streptomyces humidus]|uniref:Uncharacterized protein n=1 Tax=Streptomyces humidus TaxID=52259 RepID=A0A918FS40_9ACTN|nr:hypothetical protein GCM10010269_13240 [Streptomyces humidus]